MSVAFLDHRNRFGSRLGAFQVTPSEMGVLALLTALVWVILIRFRGGYSNLAFGAGVDEFKIVVHASLLTAAVVGIGCYLLRAHASREAFVLEFLVGVPLLLAGRFVLRRALQRARSNGALQLRVLVLGTGAHVDEIASVLGRESWLGYDVVGALTPVAGGESGACTRAGVPILGEPRQVARAAAATGADVVFLAGGAVDSAAQVRQIAWDLEHDDVQVVVAPSVTDVSHERVRARAVGGLPLIHLEKPRTIGASRSAKRLFDVVGSSSLLIGLAPLLLLCAASVWLHDRGPVLFRHPRVGRGGVTFSCLRFRTTAVDVPCVSAPGRWLRRFSLHQLPQLVNVLRGDMSLVGPRPPLRHEVARYDDAMSRRLRVRPGMTGSWWASGRSALSRSETLRLDLYYVDNWSMVQDLAILARTVGAVLGSRGAH